MKKFDKLLNLRPVLYSAVSLSVGIAFAYFIALKNVGMAILFGSIFALAITMFLLFFVKREKLKKSLVYALIFTLFFAFGSAYFSINLNSYQKATLGNHYFTVTGKIESIKDTDYGSYAVLEKVSVKGIHNGKINYKLATYIYGENDLDVGNLVKFDGLITDKDVFYDGTFNAYGLADRVKYATTINASEIIVTGQKTTVFEKVNLFFRNSLQQGLGEQEFSVAYALITGGDEYMDADVISSYRTAGVAHIFAVSGLHIGFLAMVFNFIFDKLKMNKFLKAFILTGILLFYSGVCGFSASSIRATIMTSVALFATAKGERYDGLSSTAIAGIIVLLINPAQLLCAGFQLSFGVVIGINLLSPPITKSLKFLPNKISSAIGVVVSAQLFAIPISLSAFGNFSLIAVIINLVFVPFVSIIYVLTFVCALIGGIFNISHITLFPCQYVFKFVNMCITAFDWKIFLIGGFSLSVFIIFYYLALVTPCGLVNLKRKAKSITAIVCASICIVGTVAFNLTLSNANYLYVIGSQNLSVSVIESKDHTSLIVSNSSHIFSSNRLKRLVNAKGIEKFDSVIFMDNPIDMQVFLTKVNNVTSFDSIYYYGLKDENMERAITLSFGEREIISSIEKIPMKEFDAKFIVDGKAVELNVNGSKILIASKNDGQYDYSLITSEYDYAVMNNGNENMFNQINAKNKISYRYSAKYKNAESGGNLAFRIK